MKRSLVRRLAEARVAILGTRNPDGTIHLVPVVFVNDSKNIYFIVDRKPKRSSRLRRISNIQRTGMATFLVHHYAEDWHKLSFTMVYTRASVLGEQQSEAIEREKLRAAGLLRKKYVQYSFGNYFPENVTKAVIVRLTPADFYKWP